MGTREIVEQEIIDAESDEYEEGLYVPAYDDRIDIIDDSLIVGQRKSLPAIQKKSKTKLRKDW